MTQKMQVGDLLTFKSATRDSYRKAKRIIRDFDYAGRPAVGYAGYDYFIVLPHEIISVEHVA